LVEDLAGLQRDTEQSLSGGGELKLDYAYAAAHLLDTVPNPWVGYEFVERTFTKLLTKYKGKERVVANNLVFILEELRKRLEQERDGLAEEVFNSLLNEDEMRFMVVLNDLGVNRPPEKVDIRKPFVKATRLDGNQFMLNLYDPMAADSLNSLEHEVASFLDEQSTAILLVSEHSPPWLLRAGLAEVPNLCGFHFYHRRRGGDQERLPQRSLCMETKGRNV
jgi:hypothetical protein